MNPGSIVRCRNREWVLLPADTDEVFLLRPLAGTTDDVVEVHRRLSNLVGYDLPFERVMPAAFPLPAAEDVADKSYELSGPYREQFERTYEFCSEIVRSGDRLEAHKRRVRYWGALALLRCVMSSPAAASAAMAIGGDVPAPPRCFRERERPIVGVAAP